MFCMNCVINPSVLSESGFNWSRKYINWIICYSENYFIFVLNLFIITSYSKTNLIMSTKNETTDLKKRSPRRSKFTQYRDILDAIAELVGEEGFANISLTSISQITNIGGTVIVRNFGSLESLLDRYAQIFDYWYDDIIQTAKSGNPDEPEQLYREILCNTINSLYKNKNMRQLLLWEMTEENDTTKRVAYNREHIYDDVLNNYEEVFKDSGLDIRTMTGIIVAGISYLLMYRKKSSFLGVDYSQTKKKERLIKAVSDIVSLYFSALKQKKEIIVAAKNLKERGVDTAIIADCLHIDREVVEKL